LVPKFWEGKHTENRLILLDNVTLPEINKEILDIAQIYIDRKLMPNDINGDALHLAIASYHKIDSVLTWNWSGNIKKIRLRFEQTLGTL